jgi:hypothetical protein
MQDLTVVSIAMALNGVNQFFEHILKRGFQDEISSRIDAPRFIFYHVDLFGCGTCGQGE